MAEVSIDAKLFHERITKLANAWKHDLKANGDNGVFAGANSFVVLMGRANDDAGFLKSNAIHFWLLGYEFPATLLLFTPETLYILTTVKKAQHLEQLRDGRFPIEILARTKDAAENEKLWDKIVDVIKRPSVNNKLGVISKCAAAGPFVDEWKKIMAAEKCSSLEQVDISPALSRHAFSAKDESELRAMRTASKACVAMMNPYFLDEMSNILDEEKKVKHDALSQKIENKAFDTKFWKSVELPNKTRMPSDFDPSQLDWVAGPSVQSGGKYDLRIHSESNQEYLHAGIIVASMGLRYKSYSSAIARTYLIDPNKSQESHYKLLCQVHSAVLKEIQAGVVAKDVYNKAISVIRASKHPELEKHLLKNVGWGIGLEYRDSALVLNGKNTRELEDGMTLSITTGFADIENPSPQDDKSKVYSLLISDTIRVTASSDPVVFTEEAPIDANANSFFFKDEEEDAAKPNIKKESKDSASNGNGQRSSRAANSTSTRSSVASRTRLRSDRAAQPDEDAEIRRREHQKELAAKKHRDGLQRFSEATGDQNGVVTKKFKKFESYKRDDQVPAKARDLQIVVDQHTSTIVLPVLGRPVPFHINTIKNASVSEEGDMAYLRINFLSPGQSIMRKDDQPFEDASAHFVRSLTFCSEDRKRYGDIANSITNMKRDLAKREQERKDMADVVEQDKLVEIRNRRPMVLDNVFIRPGLEGKRVPGKMEIHQNGIRYQSPLSTQQRVDILFSNVRHLFFQPCANELVVIIHIHLKTPIIVGNKKKTKDVQFYREASDIQFDETGNRKRKYRYGDEDEFEQEQEERRRRAELDRLFQNFAQKIAEAGRDEGIVVDMPIRDLGFYGVPFRSNVYIQPTTDCLIQVVEPPFMVLTLEDIEIAHLERVQFGLKNFDMVFVFKDYSRPPYHVNTIPVEHLDEVKEWLDSCDILFSEGPLNLSWPTIMKTVTTDPHDFYLNGGWSFLQEESDDEGGDESDEESAFEMSDSDGAAASESSDEESDYSVADSDDEGSGSEDELSEEGEDWDELERQAKRKDRESGMEEEDRRKKARR